MEKLKTLRLDTLVYVDEMGIDRFLFREYAYAPRGQKVIGRISGKKFKRTNFVAGICQNEWVAPLEYYGTTDSLLFECWFEKCLLQEVKTGSTIVLDNAAFHRKFMLFDLAQQYDCEVVFLPPYSPDLNPIEKKWAWLKKRLRNILPLCDTFENALSTCF